MTVVLWKGAVEFAPGAAKPTANVGRVAQPESESEESEAEGVAPSG